MKFLFQIARRRRTSRIFTIIRVKTVMNLLMSLRVMIKLTQEQVPCQKYTWKRGRSDEATNTLNLYHSNMLVNEKFKMNWETSYWSRCPGYISTWWGCYWYPFDSLQIIFHVTHKFILRIWTGCLIQKRIGDLLTPWLSNCIWGQRNRFRLSVHMSVTMVDQNFMFELKTCLWRCWT